MMKKFITITTLSAGIVASIIGITSNAYASEYNSMNLQHSSYNMTTQMANTSYSTENLYTAGQRTWYVFDKVNGKIGSTWGNVNNWASATQEAGYTVNHTSVQGAILQSSIGAYGHVAYVERFDSNGSSEMNYNGGPYVVDTRTIPSNEASSYNYIHMD